MTHYQLGNPLQSQEAFRRLLERRNEIAEEMHKLGWKIWALNQEDARLHLNGERDNG